MVLVVLVYSEVFFLYRSLVFFLIIPGSSQNVLLCLYGYLVEVVPSHTYNLTESVASLVSHPLPPSPIYPCFSQSCQICFNTHKAFPSIFLRHTWVDLLSQMPCLYCLFDPLSRDLDTHALLVFRGRHHNLFAL